MCLVCLDTTSTAVSSHIEYVSKFALLKNKASNMSTILIRA